MLFFTRNNNLLYSRAAMLLRQAIQMKEESNVADFDLSKLTVESSFVFDMFPLAQSLEARFGNMLRPAPVGIYLRDRLEPVFYPGAKFYIKVNEQFVQIHTLDGIVSTVYDANHLPVISAFYLKHAASFLKDSPTLPFHGIQIIEGLVKQRLDQFVQWRRRGSSSMDWLDRHFVADANKHDVVEIGEWHLDEVSDIMGEWLSSNHWNLFFTKRSGSQMRVDRCGDYRILDWMHRYEAGEITL